MTQFKRYSLKDEAPSMMVGWLFVQYSGSKIKIVDNQGNSMEPMSRAVVDGTDSTVKALVADGVLKVVAEGDVPAEEAIVVQTEDNSMIKKLRTVVSSAPEPFVGEPAQQASEEAIVAKSKARKKKFVDTEAPVDVAAPTDNDATVSNEVVDETIVSDSATPDEEPSV